MTDPIGGHDNAFGRMMVYRHQGAIVKVAHDALNADALRNEARLLSANKSPLVPQLIEVVDAPHPDLGGVSYTVQQDMGVTQDVRVDSETLRRAMMRLLADIRAAGMRHGDLTGPNVIVRDGGARLIAVDWQESHLLGATPPQKSAWSDSEFACRWIADTTAVDGMPDTPRIARRWSAVLRAFGADIYRSDDPLPLTGRTFVDYGCFQGDFVALAACDGMEAVGIDQGGFRSGENSIEIGRHLWSHWPIGSVTLVRTNMRDAVRAANVAVCFSAWPYMVTDFGLEAASAWLAEVVRQSDVLFFETQLAGDGPGPDFLRDHADVARLLTECGAVAVAEIARIPVSGRAAERSVWRASRLRGR